MKISVTKRELQSILSSHFRVNVTEVEMLDHTDDLMSLLNTKIAPYVADPSQKIPMIKEIRSLSSIHIGMFGYGLGLAEAKYAIENWATFTQFIKANGRIPKSGFCNGSLI